MRNVIRLIAEMNIAQQFPLLLIFVYVITFLGGFPFWINVVFIPIFIAIITTPKLRMSMGVWAAVWLLTAVFLITNIELWSHAHLSWFLLTSIMLLLTRNSGTDLDLSLKIMLMLLVGGSLLLKLINIDFLSGDLFEYSLLTNHYFSWLDPFHSNDLKSIISANRDVISNVFATIQPFVLEGYAGVKAIANSMTLLIILLQFMILGSSIFLLLNKYRVLAFGLIILSSSLMVTIFPVMNVYLLISLIVLLLANTNKEKLLSLCGLMWILVNIVLTFYGLYPLTNITKLGF